MSKVFGFSGSYLLLITTVLIIGLSLQTGYCQIITEDSMESYYESDGGDDPTPVELETNFDSKDDNLDMREMASVSSQDVQNIVASSEGPLGLWSGLKTEIMFAEDGSLQKSRRAGLFTYGSDLLKIDEYSEMSLEDNLDYGYKATTLDQSIILENAKYPFLMYREDLTSVSYDWDRMNSEVTPFLENTNSKTYLFLDSSYYDAYNISALDAAFGDTNIYEKFEYDPDMSKLYSELGVDLGIFFPPGMWEQFAKIFHDFAVEQLKKQNEEQNNEDTQKYIENMFNDCSGGVCCKWGTTS